jgi:hypothetical protein
MDDRAGVEFAGAFSSTTNVRPAVKNMRIDYRLRSTTTMSFGPAFRNQVWPAFHFLDAHARIRHYHLSEGGYDQSEMVVQPLLAEARSDGIDDDLGRWPSDWASRKIISAMSARRTLLFPGAMLAEPRRYELPTRLPLNDWALSSDCTVKNPAVMLNMPDGRTA